MSTEGREPRSLSTFGVEGDPVTGAVSFETHPDQYRHWRLELDPPLAWLELDVDDREDAAAGSATQPPERRRNRYDLEVEIELSDAVQRLRFEHPEVHAIVLTSGRAGIFCPGTDATWLAAASHPLQVNFHKLSSETRNAIEDATANSRQTWIAALNGDAAGSGYDLALACDRLLLADDGSTVALPEVPQLGILPSAGALTRLTETRRVRRDHVDVLATSAEGVAGQRAIEWGLVDELVPPTQLTETARSRAREAAENSDRPADAAAGITLTPVERMRTGDTLAYPHVRVELDRGLGVAVCTVRGPEPDRPMPTEPLGVSKFGASFWPLAVARELDDALLHLRTNELELGVWVLRSEGDLDTVSQVDGTLLAHRDHWLVREIVLYWRRVLERLDVTARSLIGLVEPGSCFAGTLLELVLAADRGLMLDTGFDTGVDEVAGGGGADAVAEDVGAEEVPGMAGARVRVTGMNLGPLATLDGRSRLEVRCHGQPERLAAARGAVDRDLDAAGAQELGLVTFTPDELDWPEHTRRTVEERASLSPDALTALEASLRFPGSESPQTGGFGRAAAWQNWILQRPNAVGEDGALRRYGTGSPPRFDRRRT